MPYKSVIFDMDGTLLDTVADLTAGVNHALSRSGLSKRSVAEVRSFVGNGIRQTLKLSAPDNTPQSVLDQLYSDFTDYYEVHNTDHTVVYPGLMQLLTTLRQYGILTAVVSNKQDAAVHTLAAQFFPGLFDLAVGQRDGLRRKPAPDSVNLVMDTFYVSPDDAVYIGDSEVDLLTAQNAGIPCISVSWGYRSYSQLKASGAKLILDSPDALLTAILAGAQSK